MAVLVGVGGRGDGVAVGVGGPGMAASAVISEAVRVLSYKRMSSISPRKETPQGSFPITISLAGWEAIPEIEPGNKDAR